MSAVLGQPRRIGIFGGAFDPPHAAHVALARAAVEQLQLERLHIVPTGFAWHKSRTLTDAHHRLAMCELAFSGLRPVQIDARETLRSGPTYTADTLRELRLEYPDAEFFLLIGEDQARALPGWHRIEEVLKAATICVAARPDSSQFNPLSTDSNFAISAVPAIRTLTMQPMSVSATDIRLRLAQHLSVTPLVSDSVARYIDQHHLYQSA